MIVIGFRSATADYVKSLKVKYHDGYLKTKTKKGLKPPFNGVFIVPEE